MNPDLKILLSKIYSFDDCIVTMTSDMRHDSFDIHKGVVKCYEDEDEMNTTFELLLKLAFGSKVGTLVIREFLPETFKKKCPNGKILDIPKKNIYHVVMSNGGWRALTSSEVSECQNTDAKTGEMLCPEDGVSFCEL
jgi:hypothetical protein